MPAIYANALKNTRMEAVVSAIGANGFLVIGTSALSGATGVLASIPLAATAGVVSNGALTLSGTPLSGPALAAGTPALAELRTSGGTTVISGLTAGTSGTNIILSSETIALGNTIIIQSGVITHG